MSGFLDLNINKEIAKALEKEGIKVPTKIQSSAIPSILMNLDIIAESETGSGKTLAYLLPLIEKVNYEKKENQFIILAPTHELGIQINNVIQKIKSNSGLNLTSAVIIGNVNIKRQVEALKEKPQFVIGSPGRILELIKLKKISAHTVKAIVIDECDRLLDENNIDTVKAVIKTTLKERQIIMLSASITEEVIQKGKAFMKEPKVIKEEGAIKVSENIEHLFMVCDRRDKILSIRKLMAALKPTKAIAFINKTDEIEILSSKLKFHGLKADGIHGAFVKNERKKVMDDFKTGKINLLVASDLAARGLDIEGVTHIFNIDIPEEPKDYLHRSGRTGRAGNKGIAISIVTDNEVPKIKKFENQFKINVQYVDLFHGKLVEKNYKPAPVNNTSKEQEKKGQSKDSNLREDKNNSFRENKYNKENKNNKATKDNRETREHRNNIENRESRTNRENKDTAKASSFNKDSNKPGNYNGKSFNKSYKPKFNNKEK